jgi:hypothetical protein
MGAAEAGRPDTDPSDVEQHLLRIEQQLLVARDAPVRAAGTPTQMSALNVIMFSLFLQDSGYEPTDVLEVA